MAKKNKRYKTKIVFGKFESRDHLIEATEIALWKVPRRAIAYVQDRWGYGSLDTYRWVKDRWICIDSRHSPKWHTVSTGASVIIEEGGIYA